MLWPEMHKASALVFLVGLACATPGPVSLDSNKEVRAEDYEKVLAKWTRTDQIYSQLYSVMFVHATFHAPEFRRGFLVRHPDVYGPGSEEASRLLLTKPEGELQHEFFLSASTSTSKWNDLADDDSIWQVSLQGDDREPVDAKVERVKTTANLRVIYPYITDYARTYAIHAPLVSPIGEPVLTKDTRRLTLRIASALGEAKLVWELIP